MIYVAGSSQEIERAEKWAAALRQEKIDVTSNWPENIREVQRKIKAPTTLDAANPKRATVADRRGWAQVNVDQVRRSESLWLLIPGAGITSQGAYYELAIANENGKRTIGSGGDQRFIFAALSTMLYETDEEAFEALRIIHQPAMAL